MSARLLPRAEVVLALAMLAVLSLPLLLSNPGPLTSDESRYVSEALNLSQGKGFTDAAGEPVIDRGPLFPALLAADFSVAGVSVDHARWVPRLFALAGAALLLALGWHMFGREAGMLAAATALVSALLIMMGTSIHLNGVQALFLLLTLLLLRRALMEGRPRSAALAGAALGLAALTKESALLWLPLPFLTVLLLGPAVDRPRALLLAFSAGFLAVAGWWWPYVYAVSGRVYLLGPPSEAALWLAAGVLCLGLIALAATALARRGRWGRTGPRARWIAVVLLLAAWGTLFVVGLERHAAWPFPPDYLRSVPDYLTTTLASWLRPLPVIGVAWGYVTYRAVRGSLSDRLLLLGLFLFLPYLLFAANRDLPAREMLPLAYLSCLALARTAIDFARRLAERAGETLTPAVGGALAAAMVVGGFAWYAVAETQRFADYRAEFDPAAVTQEHWDNAMVRQAADWIDQNVPPGTPIMSTQLYQSHLHTLTAGAYPWLQFPSVRVEIQGNPPVAVRASAASSLHDSALPQEPPEPWLYLRRDPSGPGYIALSEPDLLAELEEQQIGYLVLTGDDGGLSPLSLLPYFEKHPAFRMVKSFIGDDRNQVHIFRVYPFPLLPLADPARVSRVAADALQDELGARQARTLLQNLSPGGYVLTNSGDGPAESRREP